MTRTLFLFALLATCIFANYGNVHDTQIQELKNAQLKKQYELSALSETISKKDELLRSIEPAMVNFIKNLLKEKKESLKLNGHELAEYAQTIDNSTEKFSNDFKETIASNENIKQFLITELLDESDDSAPVFETLKFCVVRYFSEYDLLKLLIEEYGDLHQQLIEINNKLADLQK